MSDRLKNIFEGLEKYLALTDVSGLDIGYRLEDGELTNRLAVRVHVAELTTDALSSIKPNIDIQFIHGGFAPSPASLHVPVTNPQTLARRNPIQPGISIGSFECGTLGLFCKDNFSQAVGFLTCYHLINGVKGAPVTQPGPGADRGNLERDKIGRLERFLSYDLHYDAAFVRLLPARDVLHAQLLSNVTVKTPSAITINEEVSKTGRTTALTTGKVSAEGFFPIIFPGHGRKLIKGFQITTLNNARTSNAGDSGSVWYDSQTQEGKGLNFASGTGDNALSSLMSPLTEILNLLKITPL